MLTRQFPVDLTMDNPFEKYYDLNKIVLFDIETTGFSADMTYLYLIGCIYYKESSFYLIQWFSEAPREEKDIIINFFEFLKGYQVLLHYNGSGFDLPYLQRKCTVLKLDYSFDDIESIDIYKKISPYKKILNIHSLKQKSIEIFLNINRKDTFDGGDLIQVYQSYLGKKHYETLWKTRNAVAELPYPSEADELLEKLLLHNEDDVKGLIRISPILNYCDLFEKPIRILQAGVENCILTIRFEISANLPVGINFGNGSIRLSASENTAFLRIPVFEGELKYFYDNYKDYYYLPAEDSVVHKSLALYVDKEFREKAKPSNCYTRKRGSFVPQYENVIQPCFKNTVQDKQTFIEIHTDFLLQEENLEIYVKHILTHLLSSKD